MKKAPLIMAVAGGVLFAWALSHMARPAIAQQARAIALALPIVLALSLIRLLLQTSAWSRALDAQSLSIPRSKLIVTRLASQAMGYLTVLGPVLSEPMKIRLLDTATKPAITATFLDDGVYWLTTTLVGIAGWLCLAGIAGHSANVYSIAAAVLSLSAALFLITRQKPLLGVLVRRLGARSPRLLSKAEKLESSIRDHGRERPALVKQMFWLDMLCQVLVVAEVVVVLWALRLPVHLAAVLAMDGVTRGMKLISGWIPARIGSDEGGAISAFALTGYTPVLGLALALTRRIRDLLWAAIGLTWLLCSAHNSASSQPKDERSIAGSLATLMKEAA